MLKENIYMEIEDVLHWQYLYSWDWNIYDFLTAELGSKKKKFFERTKDILNINVLPILD